MNNKRDEQKKAHAAFIASLERRKAAYDENRAAFATLRRGLGYFPSLHAPMHRYVIPHLPEQVNDWEKMAYFLTAALYAAYVRPVQELREIETGSRGNLGTHFGEVAQMTEKTTSAERHLDILLTAHPHDLHYKLRRAISYLQSASAGELVINWRQLLTDIADWQDPRRRARVQDRWATHFYRQQQPTE